MLKRTPFRSKLPPARPATQWGGDSLPGPRSPALRVDDGKSRMVVSLPKENALQHAGYMNLVRAMKCAHCGYPPRSDFCHTDEGKGTGIKTDCRRGWPGCKDNPGTGRVGCHTMIGSTGYFSKAERRRLEAEYAAQTRAAIVASGAWPARLPRWEE